MFQESTPEVKPILALIIISSHKPTLIGINYVYVRFPFIYFITNVRISQTPFLYHIKISWRRINLVHITVKCLKLILKRISREMCFRHKERNYRTNLITFSPSKIFLFQAIVNICRERGSLYEKLLYSLDYSLWLPSASS